MYNSNAKLMDAELATMAGVPLKPRYTDADLARDVIRASRPKLRRATVMGMSDEELARFAVSGQEPRPLPPATMREFLRAATASQAPRVRAIAQRLGFAGLPRWDETTRDRVAAQLMHTMQAAAGAPVNAGDAKIARAIVTNVANKAGVEVAGDSESFVGDDEVGIAWWKVAAAPALGATWLAARGVRGLGKAAKWTGQKLGLVKKPKSAAERRRAALVAQANRRAAAAKRIRAAERKHEAMLMEREEARRIADAEAEALDAEAAAQEAEAIAIEAEAMKDVGDVPAIEGEFAPAGVFSSVLGAGLDSGIAHGVFDRVLGEDADAEVAAELASLVRMHGAGGR